MRISEDVALNRLFKKKIHDLVVRYIEKIRTKIVWIQSVLEIVDGCHTFQISFERLERFLSTIERLELGKIFD